MPVPIIYYYMTSYGIIMHSSMHGLPAFNEFLPSAMPRRTWLVRAWSQQMVLMPRWERGHFPNKLMMAVVNLYPRILSAYPWNIPSQTSSPTVYSLIFYESYFCWKLEAVIFLKSSLQ